MESARLNPKQKNKWKTVFSPASPSNERKLTFISEESSSAVFNGNLA
jgi:hypothetical protein